MIQEYNKYIVLSRVAQYIYCIFTINQGTHDVTLIHTLRNSDPATPSRTTNYSGYGVRPRGYAPPGYTTHLYGCQFFF